MPQDYNATVNLPKTDFQMKANLPAREPAFIERWEKNNLYRAMRDKNKDGQKYIFHDGPPYANGHTHIGHALNKSLKDFVVKYKTMSGFDVPFTPGWDCHGQPIEHMVETKLGPEKMAAIDQPTLRRLCRNLATESIDLQRDGFKRLGVLGEWDDPYLTYKPEYEAGNVEIFKTMFLNGSIYRGRKPIHWCYRCHTALAEAEIEYGDESSPSVYVAFALVEKDDEKTAVFAGSPAPLSILIWTTTPWTLPANTAVALAPDADYVVVLAAGKSLIMAAELVEQVAEVAGWDSYQLLQGTAGSSAPASLKGADLAGLHYRHPIHQDMTGLLVTGEHVELTTGTGAVHTAPGHGQEDFLMGEQYNLPMLMPVDDNGVFDRGGGPFAGQNVDEANPRIVAWLAERGSLIAHVDITHSYPHCWRCHKPVIFRATDQWFVSMEKNNLREKAIAEIDTLNWYPEWSSRRMRSMVEGRPDWCISRQRSWGVPLPVFKCMRCKQAVATEATFDAVIDLFKREGADAWFTKEPNEYLPEGTRCPYCGSTELVPEKDILDVWWESGVSHTSVLHNYADLRRPAELYLEGSDQHRGWFQSALLTSVGAYGIAPYKGIMSCGFTVDENGEKMSKSRGNGVDPADVIRDYGADVLRLWVGSVDSSQDVSIGKNILDRTADAYRRFRNIFRFLLSNLYDFCSPDDLVTAEDMPLIDRWALARLQSLMSTVDEAYEGFRFHQVYHAIYDYVVNDLSSVYLDALKDRLYSDAPKSIARRSAQTVLLNILEALVRQLAPLLSFTCDEVWEYYPAGLLEANRKPAIQLAGWPVDDDIYPQLPAQQRDQLLADFTVVLTVRDAVTKALEEARNSKVIGKSQEAAVLMRVAPETAQTLQALPAGTLEELLIVAAVTIAPEEGVQEPQVTIDKAQGEKCPRCWNIRELGADLAHPEVCARCAEVLTELGFEDFKE
ncbi:MAG: isoleucine--tRNA ligase [Coriobacteriia bacterium]|nr:isoleucine--tRNA ligase [Coriobacteriia bacterium]